MFRKSVKICKGVRLNRTHTGVGVSFGTNGCRYSVHSSGRKTATVGLPGTGLYYTKSVGGGKKRGASSSATQKKASSAAVNTAENAKRVQEFEEYIAAVKSVHKICEPPLDWNAVKTSSEPFSLSGKGPKEREAEKALEDFRPSAADKFFGDNGESKRKALAEAVETARAEDREDYAAWQESRVFAQRVLSGDTDAYLEAIEVSNPFEDFAAYGSNFEFGTDSPDFMGIEFEIKADEVIPETVLSLTETGRLSEKKMTKTMHKELLEDYVCSCAIRLAREIFSVLPVENVLVNAVDTMLDTATGNDTVMTVLSVTFNRSRFEGVNFDRIDPSDFVKAFGAKAKLT